MTSRFDGAGTFVCAVFFVLYAGKDVVFVSLALEFDYAIIPEARGISDKYGIEGCPTHYVLIKKVRF